LVYQIRTRNELANYHPRELKNKKSRFKFASNEMLIIGCGHDSFGPYENCTSTHEGFTTIDIRPEVKPDYIIDMTNPDPKISLGMMYEKIVFDTAQVFGT